MAEKKARDFSFLLEQPRPAAAATAATDATDAAAAAGDEQGEPDDVRRDLRPYFCDFCPYFSTSNHR